MKKLTIGFVIFLAGVTNSFAFPFGGSRLDICVPRFDNSFSFGLAGLYLRPDTPQFDYALAYPEIDDAGATVLQQGKFQSVDPDYNFGFRAFIGYKPPCTGNDIILAYANYNHDHHDGIDNPGRGDDSTFNLFTTLSQGGGTGGLSPDNIGLSGLDIPIDFALAKAEFDDRVWDLEVGQSIRVGCQLKFRFYTGVRVANLEHKLDTAYLGSLDLIAPPGEEDVFARLDVNQRTEFDGVGPRFGIDAIYNLAYGFGLSGGVAASLLVGDSDANYKQHFIQTDDRTETLIISEFTQTYSHPDETRVVPNVDARVGLGYTYVFCNPSHSKVTFEGGYFVSYFWNAVDRLSGVLTSVEPLNEPDAVITDQPELRTRHTIDTSFEGPYVALLVQL